MIDFTPLFETLEEKRMKKSDLYEILDEVTVSNFGKNASFHLTTIKKVCLFLNVPIEKVVRINREKPSDD